ncbi:MAG: DUF481 domain-containing protein [Deltaproteobacteria bacterium]|nr:DUF481 domain-containing protein [Deltaproteobacteria bacterium]
MRNINLIITICSLFLSLFFSSFAWADEILLKNGDRISGKIVTMAEGKIVMNTTYGGDISIAWDEISKIMGDEPITVVLSDGTSLKGRTIGAEPGKLVLQVEGISDPVSLDLATTKSVNPAPVPALTTKGQANLGITIAKGNSETESQHLDLEFIARTVKNRYTLGAEFNRAEDDGVESTNNSLGYVKYDHFFSKKLYGYSNVLLEKDKFKDINLRTALGLGAGYQFIESEEMNLSGEAGLSYINEDFIIAPDESYPTGRWAINFDKYLIAKTLQFFHFHEGFISLEDTEDLLIRSRTGIRMPLSKSVKATCQVNYDWDRKPSPGMEKADIMYIVSIGYQF